MCLRSDAIRILALVAALSAPAVARADDLLE
jgi:hypothetical protein